MYTDFTVSTTFVYCTDTQSNRPRARGDLMRAREAAPTHTEGGTTRATNKTMLPLDALRRLPRRCLPRVSKLAASTVAARVVYPIRPPDGQQSGRIIDDQLFHKMAHIPPEQYSGAKDTLHDEEEAHDIRVVDGRSMETPPSLSKEGFELWHWPTGVSFEDDDEILCDCGWTNYAGQSCAESRGKEGFPCWFACCSS